jgi:hypothetical protein
MEDDDGNPIDDGDDPMEDDPHDDDDDGNPIDDGDPRDDEHDEAMGRPKEERGVPAAPVAVVEEIQSISYDDDDAMGRPKEERGLPAAPVAVVEEIQSISYDDDLDNTSNYDLFYHSLDYYIEMFFFIGPETVDRYIGPLDILDRKKSHRWWRTRNYFIDIENEIIPDPKDYFKRSEAEKISPELPVSDFTTKPYYSLTIEKSLCELVSLVALPELETLTYDVLAERNDTSDMQGFFNTMTEELNYDFSSKAVKEKNPNDTFKLLIKGIITDYKIQKDVSMKPDTESDYYLDVSDQIELPVGNE